MLTAGDERSVRRVGISAQTFITNSSLERILGAESCSH